MKIATLSTLAFCLFLFMADIYNMGEAQGWKDGFRSATCIQVDRDNASFDYWRCAEWKAEHAASR